jgi:hypothetical protein
VLRLDGVVEHKAKSASGFTPARVNLDVCLGDSIRTGERSRVTIVFVDDTRLVIDQNTEWVVRPPSTPGRTLIDLVRGAILFFARQPRSLDVKTPFANAAVEGTEFLVRVEADRTFISVFEGHVSATNDKGSLTLTRDESAIAIQGQAPQRQVVVRPRDAVQWALYYEPILPADSLEQLDKVPEPERNAALLRTESVGPAGRRASGRGARRPRSRVNARSQGWRRRCSARDHRDRAERPGGGAHQRARGGRAQSRSPRLRGSRCRTRCRQTCSSKRRATRCWRP